MKFKFEFRIKIGLDKGTRLLALAALETFSLARQGQIDMDILTQLEAEVGNSSTIDDSVSALINEMGALVLAAAPNNARLTAVVATLTANDARLAALVTANTPVASGAPAVPPPVDPSTVTAAIPSLVQAAARPAVKAAVAAVSPATLSAAAAHANAAKA